MSSIQDLPEVSEKLDAMDHMRTDKAPSALVPGINRMKVVLVCPACKAETADPRHYHPIKCGCGLTMELRGTNLHIWRVS